MLSNQPILVTGIGTDVGKTMVCRAICTQLNRPYFKPIQCGLDQTDSDVLRDTNIQVFSEAFSLKAPLSPHHAAEIEQVKVLPEHIVLPEVDNLIIEGAGGLMVPFNYKGYTYADFAKDKNIWFHVQNLSGVFLPLLIVLLFYQYYLVYRLSTKL